MILDATQAAAGMVDERRWTRFDDEIGSYVGATGREGFAIGCFRLFQHVQSHQESWRDSQEASFRRQQSAAGYFILSRDSARIQCQYPVNRCLEFETNPRPESTHAHQCFSIRREGIAMALGNIR